MFNSLRKNLRQIPPEYRRWSIFGFSCAVLVVLPITVWGLTSGNYELRKIAAETPAAKPRLIEQSYLKSHEPSNREFKNSQIADMSVYFYQRVLDGAIVEKDFINYQFDKQTGNFLKKLDHWRQDLPEHLPPLKVTKDKAESMTLGKVQFSNLYIISPESDVFPLKPTPKNPCWVVNSLENGFNKLTVIDAISGKIIGYGNPPPSSNGYSLSGPVSWSYSVNTNEQYKITDSLSPIPTRTPTHTSALCKGAWDTWYTNAKVWFERMGYPTASAKWPSKESLASYLQNPLTKVFYEIAHGGSTYFHQGCADPGSSETTSTDIRTWLAGREKISFTFIASCGGMCDTGAGRFSYEFRKGSDKGTVTVGYCGMANSICSNCWINSVLWQNNLFKYMSQGNTVKISFDKALADSPVCGPPNNCMRFAGDERYKITDPLCSSLNGPCGYGFTGQSLGECCPGLFCRTFPDGGKCVSAIIPTPTPTPPGAICGYIKNAASGAGISGAGVSIYNNDAYGPSNGATVQVTTNADGFFTTAGSSLPVGSNNFYAVRPNTVPTGYVAPAKTTTLGWTWDYCLPGDTPLNSSSYGCQQFKVNDCANGDSNPSNVCRCNFKYNPVPPTPAPVH